MSRFPLALAGSPFLFALAAAQGSAPASAPVGSSLVEGDVRVQALSPTLVRLEVRGPKGFEDRETFHVLRRDWPGVGHSVVARGKETAEFVTPRWKVAVPRGAKSLQGVRIVGTDDRPLYAVSGKESSRAWLPSPGATPRAWAFADTPRIVPSPWGATPAPNDDPTSGWDLANGATDVYVFLPERSYSRLRADFLRLTGPSEMPPLFMLGLIDSKYHPYTETEALARVDEYRKRRIPLDVLTIDTDWRMGGSHGYKADPRYFPDMPGFLQRAKAKGVRVMFNDHPEPQQKTALDPKEVAYRWKGLTELMGNGLDVWWYDRNWNVGLHEPVPGLAGHVWGMRVYQDVTARFRPTERPVIMANTDGIDNGIRNRAPDVAAHRFSVQWTGDTQPKWSFLRRAVENAVQGGVEALNPWINDDLGGHTTGPPSQELYVRFMQYGSLCPVMRPHCTRGDDRAPWTFGPEAERIVTEYVRLRYRLLPLLYASARESYDSGEPIVRRLDLDFPGIAAAKRDDQFLLGRSLLVAPVVDHRSSVLPASAVGSAWRAEYFANGELEGEPVLRREEATLGFDLTRDPVAPGVPADHFSARWTGSVTIPGKTPMRLVTTSDDGVRVWVDGKLALDRWAPQDSIDYDVPVDLAPGSTHAVRIEYMELDGGAMMRIGLAPAGGEARRELWVPPGTWIDLWGGRRVTGPRTISAMVPLGQMPMFAKEGAVVATLPQMEDTDDSPWREVRLEAFAGADGETSLYEDDGHSVGYRDGACRRTRIAMRSGRGATTVAIAPARGTYAGAISERAWTLRLHLPPGRAAVGARVNGKAAEYRVLAKDAGGPMPFGGGAAGDGALVEVSVPPTAVRRAVSIEVRTR